MRALLLIDIQSDFMPNGALPVPGGDEVIPVANQLMREYELVVATQDWHPANHKSFASQHPNRKVGDVIELDGIDQILWPDHCVQNTAGADFAPLLDRNRIQHVVQKGTDCRIDSYSGFFDNARRRATGLEQYLRSQGVDAVHLVGLATEYCVKATLLDALDLGFSTVLIKAGTRSVDLHPGDCQRALAQMQAAGVQIV